MAPIGREPRLHCHPAWWYRTRSTTQAFAQRGKNGQKGEMKARIAARKRKAPR